MDEDANRFWQTARDGNLSRAHHRDEVPAHLTGGQRGVGGGDIVGDGEKRGGDVVRFQARVGGENRVQQFTRGREDVVFRICFDGGRAANAALLHEVLLVVNKKGETVWSRPLRVQSYRSACLSAANGNRIAEAVKVVRKIEADGGGHIGRYSMREAGMSQEGGFVNLSKFVMLPIKALIASSDA